MLSQEHRSNFDTCSIVSGIRNGVFAGIVSELDARDGKCLQTRYANLAIPIRLAGYDSKPARVRRGNPVKFISRAEGGRYPQIGEPTSVLRLLRFELPRVMDLPPEADWEIAEWAGRLAREANEARQRKVVDRRKPADRRKSVMGTQSATPAESQGGDDTGSINRQRVAAHGQQVTA